MKISLSVKAREAKHPKRNKTMHLNGNSAEMVTLLRWCLHCTQNRGSRNNDLHLWRARMSYSCTPFLCHSDSAIQPIGFSGRKGSVGLQKASYIRGHVDVSPRRLDGEFLLEWVIDNSNWVAMALLVTQHMYDGELLSTRNVRSRWYRCNHSKISNSRHRTLRDNSGTSRLS